MTEQTAGDEQAAMAQAADGAADDPLAAARG
jgi:hypothetical protein